MSIILRLKILLQYITVMITFYCHYFINTHDQFGVLYVRTGRVHWADLRADWTWRNKESEPGV